MANIQSNASSLRRKPSHALPAVSRLTSAVANAVMIWKGRRQSRNALGRLDPHLLRDIGVATHDAQIEMQKPFWRD